MDPRIVSLSHAAREAIAKRDGGLLHRSFSNILSIDPSSAEGHFLKGIYSIGARNKPVAKHAFTVCLENDPGRYDAGVELAQLLVMEGKNSEAKELLLGFNEAMSSSPHYLNYAGELFTRMELHDLAGPCFDKANEIQKNAGAIESNLAASLAKRGNYRQAELYYKKLLRRAPEHQRNHFELARLKTATNDKHIREMKKLLAEVRGPDANNIFLIFALAKELEDLGRWDEAFEYIKRGNNAASQESVKAGYRVETDIKNLEAIVANFSDAWLAKQSRHLKPSATPIFIVGLPRTGTTLVERIIAQHSQVETAGESFFLDAAIQEVIKPDMQEKSVSESIEAGSNANAADIMELYIDKVKYRLSGSPFFIDKLPLNILNLGYILKAIPTARIVILDRKPMDACFSMYKQPYFRFSYDLEALAKYYSAFSRMRSHWQSVAGERIVSLNYEDLVFDTEAQIRILIRSLGLDFEPKCLDFHTSSLASSTASFAQIRQKTHTDSVNKWSNWGEQLSGLKASLEASRIDTSLYKSK